METEPNAVTDTNIMEDECVEVLVKTDFSDTPRGKEDVLERTMTSFETLVHTALALEEDPRQEHSYAYSDKKIALYDHGYSFCSKLAHRKVASLSDENLSSAPSDSWDKNFTVPLLPHYRSNDSALDVTGFDSISDKCQLKTVDVFSETCILPGLSDPDLSRMNIDGQTETEASSSLPNRFQSNVDHSYSQLFKKNAGIKRGRSNDDINLRPDDHILKRKDATKLPFLDHSYQTVEWEKLNEKNSQDNRLTNNYNDSVLSDERNTPPAVSVSDESGSHLKSDEDDRLLMTSIAFPNQPLSDHTYEEMSDSMAELPLNDLIEQTRRNSNEGCVSLFSETKTDSDHSYVLLKQMTTCDDKDCDSDSLSDSGTESLNEEDNSTNEHLYITAYKDHAYVK